MPGKIEWLCLANPDRIPFHFIDQRVAGANPQFVADLLWEGGLALAQLRETIELEGPETIAAFILEPVTGPTGSPTHPMAICRVSAISWTAMGSS